MDENEERKALIAVVEQRLDDSQKLRERVDRRDFEAVALSVKGLELVLMTTGQPAQNMQRVVQQEIDDRKTVMDWVVSSGKASSKDLEGAVDRLEKAISIALRPMMRTASERAY